MSNFAQLKGNGYCRWNRVLNAHRSFCFESAHPCRSKTKAEIKTRDNECSRGHHNNSIWSVRPAPVVKGRGLGSKWGGYRWKERVKTRKRKGFIQIQSGRHANGLFTLLYLQWVCNMKRSLIFLAQLSEIEWQHNSACNGTTKTPCLLGNQNMNRKMRARLINQFSANQRVRVLHSTDRQNRAKYLWNHGCTISWLMEKKSDEDFTKRCGNHCWKLRSTAYPRIHSPTHFKKSGGGLV